MLHERAHYGDIDAGIRVVETPEGGRIRTHATNQLALTLPSIRTLALGAGALLLVCALAAAAAILFAFEANVTATQSLPEIAPILRVMAALGAVQVVCCLLIWRFFVVSRRRFTQRIQAVTGGLNDSVFMANAAGAPIAMLEGTGWKPQSEDWLQSIHPEDRAYWPVAGAYEPQRAEVRLKDRLGDWRWHRVRAMPIRNPSGQITEWIGTLHDIHDQKLASEHRDLVIEELRHRLKNLVTVIDALAKNSRRPEELEPGVTAFLKRFLGRLHALGAAGDLVLAGNRVSIEAHALVKATLAPFMSENAQRIQVGGPSIMLSEDFGAGLGLAVHELATNALKYGALSNNEGRVLFTWSVIPEGDVQNIAFEWKELGGPQPNPPAKPGFGTRMIKHVAVREKSGRVEIDYLPDGLQCRIAFVR